MANLLALLIVLSPILILFLLITVIVLSVIIERRGDEIARLRNRLFEYEMKEWRHKRVNEIVQSYKDGTYRRSNVAG